jgi:Tfp pilus assembly protein PilV
MGHRKFGMGLVHGLTSKKVVEMKQKSHSIDTGISHRKQHGFTLLETMFATMILMIGVTGLMTLFVVAAVRNTNNGDQATRTTEYAQDKMEQLLALTYGDNSSNVTGFPTTSGSCCGLTPGGSLTNLNNPYYFDYIDTAGTPVASVTAPNSVAYTRYWYIETPSGLPNMKRITVKVVANLTIGANGVASSLSPTTTLVSFKSSVTYP